MTPMDGILDRLARLEAAGAVRRVMMRYMELCDHLDSNTPWDELGALFSHDALWAGKGERYGSSFGRHSGRDAIVAMLAKYAAPVPHFAMNAHFLSSEMIEVAEDCRQALGAWMMLQTSTYADGRSDLRSARLEVRFVIEDEKWRIERFETENIFGRPVDRWDNPIAVPVPTQEENDHDGD